MDISIILAFGAILVASAFLIRRARMAPEQRQRIKEQQRRSRRDLAQWGASLVGIGLILSFAYFALPQSTTQTSGFTTVEMEPSAGSVLIALLAMLFAGLATIRWAWARVVFGIPALLTGGLLIWARLTDMDEVRDLGLEVGSGLWFGLAAGAAIVVGGLLCIAGVATVPKKVTEPIAAAGTRLPMPPPMPSKP
ncbi:MAG TPA: hypothetical protein VJ913_10120 [Actinomycetota bacterium]|nr:hypothetical protein [Actinomycetota bacterium]